MATWADKAVFYHIYPLGYTGAPERNDPTGPRICRLGDIETRLDTIQALGATALYLGPVFESVAHGYDTVDYRRIDRRLGSNEDFGRLARAIKARGMRLVLDGVFNHVGLDHPWFQDLLARGQDSPCRGFFKGLDLGRPGPGGSPFHYEAWRGCADLAVLDLGNPEVRRNLIEAVGAWIQDWDLDGLRLDAADCVDLGFQAELAAYCRARKPGFWLMGEIIHGNYRTWASPGPLDSVTNYEAWKGLWSSLKDGNYHELAWTLKREFGEGGLYQGLGLYNFADNHDVDRVASLLEDPGLLYPLYCALYTMPGIPSIYYGSELGARGAKQGASDRELRRPMAEIEASYPGRDLATALARLARLRGRLPALTEGGYREVLVKPRQLAFVREAGTGPGAQVLVLLNAEAKEVDLDLALPFPATRLRDELEAECRPGGEVFEPKNGRLRVRLHPRWARVLSPI